MDKVSNLDSLVGPTLDVLMLKANITNGMTAKELLVTVQEALNRGRGHEHTSYFGLWRKLGAALGDPKPRAGTQTCIIYQNLPSVIQTEENDEATVFGMERAEELMATACCLYIQVFPRQNDVLLRTAFDDRHVTSDAALAFVDDYRNFMHLLLQEPAKHVWELFQDMPSRAKSLTTLPRAAPMEVNDLVANPPAWWAKRLLRGIFLTVWFNWFAVHWQKK